MGVGAKISKLEQRVFGRNGLPAWALEVAEAEMKAREMSRLFQPNREALEQALMKADPTYRPKPREPKPHPISDSDDPNEYAAAVVAKFKTRENCEEWKQQRREEGLRRLSESLERLKADVLANERLKTERTA